MPATDWKETIPEDEAKRFESYAELFAAMQAAKTSPDRALHSKANLGVEGEFEVLADLPAEAKQGLFAKAGTYRALVRYSNGAPRHQGDNKPDVRGLAIKLFGVGGKKLIPGMEDEQTQDFLAIRSSVLPVRDAAEFMAIVKNSKSQLTLPFKLIGALGFGRAIKLLRSAVKGLKAPQSPLAATSFYSALPIAFGTHAVQFAFTATDPPAPAKVKDPTQLGDELAARLQTKAVVYDFQIRFFVDEATTPIEDASVEWASPWVTVGRLTLPVQDPKSARGAKVSALIETLSFDPWHALVEHRPLGNIMRARNVAYRASTLGRKAAPEPRAAPSFD